MPLPKAELDAIVAELQATKNAQIQRITQPTEDEFVFQVRAPGQTLLLYVNLFPPYERLHLIPSRPRSMPTPTDFCMVLRKHIMGARIGAIEIKKDDRIIQFHLQHRESAYTLWLELLPRRSNLMLCDDEGNLQHTYRTVAPSRGLRRGDPYAPPEAPTKKHDTSDEDGEIIDLTTESPFPINEEIGRRYAAQTEERRFQRAKQLALKQRRAESKKRRRLFQHLQRDAERCEAALAREQEAELLKGALHEIPRGAERWEVVDYYDPDMGKRWIKLDPKLSPQENLHKIFHKMKRARKGLDTIRPKLDDTELRLMELEEELTAIEAALDWDSLAPYEVEAPSKQTHGGRKQKQTKSLPYHTFTSVDGHRILVGRNSRGNDELSFRVAKGNDLWFHVRGIPGSHVVVPLAKQAVPSSELVVDAATLAAHFSKARGERHVDVMKTQAKYVRKPKGAPPGQVSVMHDDNIALRLEPERLQRLLQGDVQADKSGTNPQTSQ